MQNAEVGTGLLTGGYEHEIDSVTPLSPLGIEAEVFLPGKKVHFIADLPAGSDTLDFKLAAAAVLSSGAGSGSDEDEVSEVSAGLRHLVHCSGLRCGPLPLGLSMSRCCWCRLWPRENFSCWDLACYQHLGLRKPDLQ